eukprot:CAMPEP_0115065240 /NCGR_PEP_ID=MMETSP0227-20121206/10141_1 /TAXON_ID=89957 /ORGANISM="Polarella glacialis, Strain CCMP 1383" /LENGTH=32 /DNA_ID= /DNA_START= /DNA_END= /DNA_ORIENTATION=
MKSLQQLPLKRHDSSSREHGGLRQACPGFGSA